MALIPETQFAVQLVGPGELTLNDSKPVPPCGPHQILVKTEAVGLCFSDLKLLAQFSGHVRKSEILTGLTTEVLAEIPSYVPGEKPTVPGHEVVCRVVAVGDKVRHYTLGDRYIVQADYRPLKTAGSNGAFGYNFEGGLQEYILLDERVIGDPDEPEGYMIRVDDSRGDSAVALVEPWACVENSYASTSRCSIKNGGNLLIVVDDPAAVEAASKLAQSVDASIMVAGTAAGSLSGNRVSDLTEVADESYDDIVYFGHDAATIEILNDKLAKGAVINVVLGGKKIGKPVTVGVGRIHYGGTRWVGTTGTDPLASYAMIPKNGEIRPNDRILIAGAGGPMGQMHVIRDLSAGLHGVAVVATDVDENRLQTVARKVEAIGKSGPSFSTSDSRALPADEKFTYFALMAPIPVLVEDSIQRSKPGAIVNIFAGIPAPVKHPLDLDTLIERQVFLFGTSGSEPQDMRAVLAKVTSGALDTNTSVAAISGMAGAKDGLAAVENRTLDGKIIVYPFIHEVGLVSLVDLPNQFPTVAAKLRNGQWCKEAEEEFLRVAQA
ncbi:MAG: alcohol dehydrogenase catalytic domain-containing protein [Fimbriimonas sp.]|nr:alcohol dehydrogenase catalytic domain-containing protein [Fimbriimonas sp.]